MIGQRLSAETRAKISAARKGVAHAPGCQHCVSQKGNRNNLVHGHTTRAGYESRTYRSWRAMWKRCTWSRAENWRHYGGRGISVCERWRDFAAFLGDMGERPAGKTLDRIDSNGNYEPGNCRWATPSEQRRNQRVAA